MNEAEAVDFIRLRFGLSAEITPIRPGAWSVPYSVRTGDADLVVRFSALADDFERDAYAARYNSDALPIPEILE